MGAKIAGAASSLHPGLHPVVSTRPPSKLSPAPWCSAAAWNAYLTGKAAPDPSHFPADGDLFAAEQNIGIGIDPETETQDGERFYSASYLRLRKDVRLGLVCQCMDKGSEGDRAENDLIASAFPNSGARTHILAGGQQRTCSVVRKTRPTLELPAGPEISGNLVKWTLLSPAIFPRLDVSGKNPTFHPGGWLPSWIHPESLAVQLKDPAAAFRGSEGRSTWRNRVAALPAIDARLVAALVPRAIPVTGWALHDTHDETGAFDQPGGARATHLAVPAGSVYYFEAANETAARQLAAALNWHGAGKPDAIRNRRSTIMGEKGFGLGVCTTWAWHAGM
jgi:hypothetical protein